MAERCDQCGAYHQPEKCSCGGEYHLQRSCGAMVCDRCDDHKGLARCFCGWSRSGEDGRRELIEMGETIDEDGY